jgi:aminoglycoside 3-N-acetyltransferase
MSEKTVITRRRIVADLEHLGLKSGENVLVHSSLSSLGFVEGGANSVIDALLEVLGPQGTLLMPSFQQGSEHELLRRGCLFDVRTSPSELGIISETFRRRPGVIRSLSPTHCTAGIGPRACDLLADHQTCRVSVGHGSPYEKLVQIGGRILLLGVTHIVNTTLHLVENINGAPTLCTESLKGVVIDSEGQSWTVPTYPHRPGLPRRYDRVEDELIEASIQRNGDVGRALSRLIEAKPMAEMIGKKIQKTPLYLCEVIDAV